MGFVGVCRCPAGKQGSVGIKEEYPMKERFEVLYKEIHSAGLEKRIIYVDKDTGVNYLYIQNGYSGGLTPLLDADGKPLVTK